MKKTLFHQILILVVLPLFWGSTFLATKVCLEELPPTWLGAIRYSLSSLIFLGMLMKSKRPRNPLTDLKHDWMLFFAVGLIGTFAAAFFQNIGLRFTTASTSSLINTLEPVLVALMSVLFLKEQLSRGGIIGLVIAFVGGFVIITNGNPATLFHLNGTVKGNLLILISIISYACYTIFTKLLVGKTEPINAVTFSSMIGTIFLFIAAFAMEPFPVLADVSWLTWAAVVYLAVFPTCIALLLFNQLLTQVEASRTSIVLFLIPVYGLLLGVVFLGDPLTLPMILGGILTIIGVWLIEYSPVQKPQSVSGT